MRKAKEDPDLTEVKAVLKKLQRLDLPNGEGGGPNSFADALSSKKSPASRQAEKMGVFDRKHAAMQQQNHPPRRRPGLAYYLLSFGVLIAGAAVLFSNWMVNSPGSTGIATSVQSKEDDANLLATARRLLSEGDVAVARNRLLKGEPDRRAELAFMLAQSYDPNYLRTLPKTNSPPDRAEAERWYKKWYELAVSSGLEMDNERLKRIINAMQ